MTRILLAIGSLIIITSCAQEPVKEPADVTSHLRVNKSLDECQRLGEVRTTYETDKKLDQFENKIQAQEKMKQQAYDEYRADNIVFLSTHLVKGGFREPDVISGRGLAYKCY